MCLARGDKSDACVAIRHVPQLVIQVVGPRKSQRSVELVVQQPRLLRQRGVTQPDIEAVGREDEILWQGNPRALRIDLNRCRSFNDIGDALESHPHAGVAAHCPSQQSEIQDFLHGGRKQHRHHACLEDMVALVGQRRRLGRMVVACDRQNAAMKRGTRSVGMLEHIAATVDTRSLAVPHAKDTVVPCARKKIDLLRPPYCGRGQILVHTRPEHHVVRGQLRRGLPEALVQAPKGRAAIAGDKPAGVQSGAFVAHTLVHRQPHQGVHTAQPGPTRPQLIAILKTRSIQSLQLFRREGGIHRSGLLVGVINRATHRQPLLWSVPGKPVNGWRRRAHRTTPCRLF